MRVSLPFTRDDAEFENWLQAQSARLQSHPFRVACGNLMLASYGEEIGPWVIGGMTVVILYRWYWGGKMAPDPWERAESQPEDNTE